MASHPQPGAKPRAPLSRERVLRAALILADAGGIESLTMRKLAQVGNEPVAVDSRHRSILPILQFF